MQEYQRVHNNDYSKHVTFLIGVELQWLTIMVCSHSSSSLCVVPPPAAHTPMHKRRPSNLLMVHAVLALAVKIWLYDMTCVQADPKSFGVKIQPKVVSLCANIYGNRLFWTRDFQVNDCTNTDDQTHNSHQKIWKNLATRQTSRTQLRKTYIHEYKQRGDSSPARMACMSAYDCEQSQYITRLGIVLTISAIINDQMHLLEGTGMSASVQGGKRTQHWPDMYHWGASRKDVCMKEGDALQNANKADEGKGGFSASRSPQRSISSSSIASYGSLGHVPPRLPTISLLVLFGVNLTANYPSIA